MPATSQGQERLELRLVTSGRLWLSPALALAVLLLLLLLGDVNRLILTTLAAVVVLGAGFFVFQLVCVRR